MPTNKTVIAHISDLHFGTEDKNIADALIGDISVTNPDVVIVSGDLTQRAYKSQFRNAAEFLNKIEYPKIIIPGNHDIPLYNIFKRFISPYNNFHKFFSDEEYPQYFSDKVAIVGVNTSSPFRSQSGKIKIEDIDYLEDFFSKVEERKVKGVVIHHNIFPFEGLKFNTAMDGADLFLDRMNECGVNLVFAGHLHKSLSNTFNKFGTKNNLIVFQAGTAISSRLRKEENTYIVLKVGETRIEAEFRVFTENQFELENVKHYNRYITG